MSGQPAAPPSINALHVSTGPGGEFQVAITDNNEISRGINYWAEHDTSPSFTNPHAIDMGQSRNLSVHMGTQPLYWRAYSSYASSPPSAPVYHGGASTPVAVLGGVAGLRSSSQGTGTSAPGHGAQGPGPIPTRTPSAGYNWRGQSPAGNRTGFQGIGTPAGNNALGTVTQPSGGGLSTTEAIIASSEWLTGVAGTNTITGSTATPYSSLAPGFVVRMVPANTNSGPVTLNVNGIGAKAVTKNGSTALSGTELLFGRTYILEYDGTRWQIIGVSIPPSALVLASDTSGNPSVAALPDTNIWIGQGSGLPAPKTISGDATLSDTGVLTVTFPASVPPGTYSGTIAGTADLLTGAVTGTCTIVLP